MSFQKILLAGLFFAFLLASGCLDGTIREFNQHNCSKLNETYGSFSGTICAQELVNNFGEEIAQMRQARRNDLADQIQNLAGRKGFFTYSCNPERLEDGPQMTEAGTCGENETCKQNGNQSQCEAEQANNQPPNNNPPPNESISFKDLGNLQDILDTIESQGFIDGSLVTAFCEKFGPGLKVLKPNSNLFTQNPPMTVCDPRPGKEGLLHSLACTRKGSTPEGKLMHALEFAGGKPPIACACQTVSELSAVCTVSQGGSPCTALTGEKGLSGNAFPQSLLMAGLGDFTTKKDVFSLGEINKEDTFNDFVTGTYTWRANEFLDSTGPYYWDGEQTVALLLGRLHRINELMNGAQPAEKTSENAGARLTYTEQDQSQRLANMLEFQMFLKSDHLSNQLVQDTIKYIKQKGFGLPTFLKDEKNPWYKLGETPLIRFEPEEVSAGLYKATISIEWIGQPYQFFSETGEPLVQGITVKLEKIRDPLSKEKNPFLEIPLDWVGGHSESKDYGVRFVALESEQHPVSFSISDNAETGDFKGKKEIKIELVDSVIALNAEDSRGVVLRAKDDGSALVFSPSDAIPILAFVDQSKGPRVSYRLLKELKAWNPSVESLLFWTFAFSDQSCNQTDPALPYSIKDQRIAKCDEAEIPAFEIKSSETSNAGKFFAQTTFFKPIAEDYQLVTCGENAAFAVPLGLAKKGGAIDLQYKDFFRAPFDSVQGTLTGYSCVVHNDQTNEWVFYWNSSVSPEQGTRPYWNSLELNPRRLLQNFNLSNINLSICDKPCGLMNQPCCEKGTEQKSCDEGICMPDPPGYTCKPKGACPKGRIPFFSPTVYENTKSDPLNPVAPQRLYPQPAVCVPKVACKTIESNFQGLVPPSDWKVGGWNEYRRETRWETRINTRVSDLEKMVELSIHGKEFQGFEFHRKTGSGYSPDGSYANNPVLNLGYYWPVDEKMFQNNRMYLVTGTTCTLLSYVSTEACTEKIDRITEGPEPFQSGQGDSASGFDSSVFEQCPSLSP